MANVKTCPHCSGTKKLICPACGGAKRINSISCEQCSGTGMIKCPRCEEEMRNTLSLVLLIGVVIFLYWMISGIVSCTQSVFHVGETKWLAETSKNIQVTLVLEKNKKGEVAFLDNSTSKNILQEITYIVKDNLYTIYLDKDKSVGYTWNLTKENELTFSKLTTKKNHKEKETNQIAGLKFSTLFKDMTLHKQ